MKAYKTAGEIKVGVVGYGGAFNMGRAHLWEMQRAGMTPVAVAELDAARLEVAGKDFPGIQTYPTLTAMLKKSDVNLVTVITPHNTHAKLALEALKAGRNVVCEKPLAISTAECDAMIAAAKRGKLVLSTYHNRHWDGHILKAVEIIRGGAIGDVVRVDVQMGGWGKPGDWWRSSKSISGGILYDWGVHLLEYTLQIVNSEITEVSGHAWSGVWANQTKWKQDTNEDDACAVVRYASGAWSTLSISSIDGRPTPSWFKVTGSKGTYIMDWNSYELITHDGPLTITTRGPNVPAEGWKFYQNIADHLVKGEKLIITPEWSRRPIHILDLADKSTKKGMALKAKYA